jgi:uncharacterized protein (DUF1330 family)
MSAPDSGVYFIVSYDVTDPERYAQYGPPVRALLRRYNAELIVAERNAIALEGRPRSVNVVLRFESEEAALRWYNDPEYEPIKKIRLESTTNGTAFLARRH